MNYEARRQFKAWLSGPPRPHGAVDEERTVSFLELFYDLVYVAVVAQAAHRLSEDISIRGAAEFAIVFAMLWIAWMNGSLYVELHGRDDGRTRLLVFAQMAVLALMAVFTEHAADTSGGAFALVYAVFLALMTWLWRSVRELDRIDRPEYLRAAGWYVGGMAASTVVIGATAFLPIDLRLSVWALYAVAWFIGIHAETLPRVGLSEALLPTESLVERFGLFTIIVLGEVVFGVVNGLAGAEQDPLTILTGLLALVIGFGFWWIYFDIVGRRLPRAGTISIWALSHVPITMSIAAAGAGIVSLIEHAHDPVTPVATAWLLAGSVGLGLLALIVIEHTLVDAVRLSAVYRRLTVVLALGAVAAVTVGWLGPAPWLLALLLVGILSVLWFSAVAWLIRAGAWGGGGVPSGS